MTQRKRSQEVSFLTYPRNLDFIGVGGGEVGGASAPPVWKNFRATLFFRASASCSNILNDKKYIYSIQ